MAFTNKTFNLTNVLDSSSKKNYAKKDSILIDDRISNINDWNAAGGIGILHTSTATTLDKLSKYGI